jgi:hypothetical protein
MKFGMLETVQYRKKPTFQYLDCTWEYIEGIILLVHQSGMRVAEDLQNRRYAMVLWWIKGIRGNAVNNTHLSRCLGVSRSLCPIRKGVTSIPHSMNPGKNIPLDLNMLANVKHIDAAAHLERAHASMPRYEKYVKNGSL